MTDDHRFSDKIPASSASTASTASMSPAAFAPSEFRPPQSAPPRNPNLGPRFNRMNRQNVALQVRFDVLICYCQPTQTLTKTLTLFCNLLHNCYTRNEFQPAALRHYTGRASGLASCASSLAEGGTKKWTEKSPHSAGLSRSPKS